MFVCVLVGRSARAGGEQGRLREGLHQEEEHHPLPSGEYWTPSQMCSMVAGASKTFV